MPYATDTDKQAVFNAVCEMDSFRLHLSHPKLANWCSWNAAVDVQIKEFYAAKMVFESQLPGELDPVSWLAQLYFLKVAFMNHHL